MSLSLADMSVNARWLVPMRTRDEVLEQHTVVVRDGRILDVLPTALAARRYAARVVVERAQHILLPGLINAHTQLVTSGTEPLEARTVRDAALLGIARLIGSGTTCFCCIGYYPADSAQAASEQGMRAVIGLPVATHSSSWAQSPAEYLTRALRFRDEYRGHATIGSVFALQDLSLTDASLSRIATLAAEVDAGVTIPLHTTREEIDESHLRYGMRPLQRLDALGLLTPALIASQMFHVDAADFALAKSGGIAAVFCGPTAPQRDEDGAPAAAWAAAGLRYGIGTSTPSRDGGNDLWPALKQLVSSQCSALPALGPWDALAAATSGGAATLGLESEIGSLEPGKWADLCCLDLSGPAFQPVRAPIAQSVSSGGGAISDVWVAGRQLLNCGEYTRLEWRALSARVNAWPHVHRGNN